MIGFRAWLICFRFIEIPLFLYKIRTESCMRTHPCSLEDRLPLSSVQTAGLVAWCPSLYSLMVPFGFFIALVVMHEDRLPPCLHLCPLCRTHATSIYYRRLHARCLTHPYQRYETVCPVRDPSNHSVLSWLALSRNRVAQCHQQMFYVTRSVTYHDPTHGYDNRVV